MANQDRVAALRNRELWPLTAGEMARYTAAMGRGGVQVARGKSPAKATAACDRIIEGAIERVQAEDRAEEAARRKRVQDKANKKVQRRSESMWW
ncbi:hypothetical protein ACF1HU_35865 [Streptomyces olivaceus]|uniref:hypothetical protein n=1 Tax=Streptomyces olivaceus TaxID=47716 RepID=UPI0036FC3D7D